MCPSFAASFAIQSLLEQKETVPLFVVFVDMTHPSHSMRLTFCLHILHNWEPGAENMFLIGWDQEKTKKKNKENFVVGYDHSTLRTVNSACISATAITQN